MSTVGLFGLILVTGSLNIGNSKIYSAEQNILTVRQRFVFEIVLQKE